MINTEIALISIDNAAAVGLMVNGVLIATAGPDANEIELLASCAGKMALFMESPLGIIAIQSTGDWAWGGVISGMLSSKTTDNLAFESVAIVNAASVKSRINTHDWLKQVLIGHSQKINGQCLMA